MDPGQAAIAELLRQVVEGGDFESPRQLLKSVTSAKAVTVPQSCPYSIATNVAHTEQWQRRWLNQLKGLPALDIYRDGKDFPLVAEAEWPSWRKLFIEGLDETYALALAEPLSHCLKTDEAAYKRLSQIAVHGAYHLGQITLLKRVLSARTRQSQALSKS